MMQRIVKLMCSFVLLSLVIMPLAGQEAPAAAGEKNYINLLNAGAKLLWLDYNEQEYDVLGEATDRDGHEGGLVPGAYLLYSMYLLDPTLFWNVSAYFTDAKTNAELYMWDGNYNEEQTENLFIIGQGNFGYKMDVDENLTFALSTGVGLRAWIRKFEVEENQYSDYTTVWFIPYNFSFEYQLSPISVSLDATMRLLFNGVNMVILDDYDPDVEYLNPTLLMKAKVGFQIGLTVKYFFQHERDQANFFGLRALVISPYMDRWATGQSDYQHVWQRMEDDSIQDTGKEINKWESTSDAFGLNVGIELDF